MKENKMKNFDGLGLHPVLTESLVKMKYETPTPIQAQCIPFALDGRDIMGTAQTGTGKTAAYAIPAVQHLLNNPDSGALVLTPTRELGMQVLDIMRQLLGRDSGIDTAFLIGGDSMSKQLNQLKKKPRLIVGTPGRINDHLERSTLKLGKTDFLILDETDRMLDMGFSVQLDRIKKFLPRQRQTLMFSATLPSNINKIAEAYLDNPQRIKVGSTIAVATTIKQEIVKVQDAEKYDELLRQLEHRAGSVIIFVKTKYGTERMAKRLKRDGFEADALHGDLKQSRRTRVTDNFRKMKFQVLVATDVAARGLDIPHIEHVVNYDLPQVPEDFIHRLGRTGRAGQEGNAVSFVSPQEGRKWHAIEELLDPNMKGMGRPNRKNAKPRKGRGGKPNGKFGNNAGNGKYGDKKSFGEKAGGGKARRFDGKKKPFKRSEEGQGEGQSEGFKKKPYKKDYSRNDNRDDNRDNKGEKSYSKKPFNKDGASAGKKPFKKKPFGKSDSKPARNSSTHKSEDKRDFSNTDSAGGDKPYFKKKRSADGKPHGKKPTGKPFAKKPGKPAGKPSAGGKTVSGGKGNHTFKSKAKKTGTSNRPNSRKGPKGEFRGRNAKK